MKRFISLIAVLLVITLCSCDLPAGVTPKPTNTTYTSFTPDVSSPGESDPDISSPGESESDSLPPETSLTEIESGSGNATSAPETEPGGDSACAHVDSDDNGICDSCILSVLFSVDFYAVNDLHGKFHDTDDQPGVDELTTFLYLSQAINPNTVLLSSGDMWQGSSESNLTKGLILTDWMNELDFACMTLGNHEFDWGEQAIYDNLSLAEFPMLAINIYERGTDTLADYCTPSVLIDKGDVQIGIIGAIGDCYSSISSDKVQDVYFVLDDELTELVKAESEKLRAKGADIIVYSIHDGGGEYDLTLSNGYVDLVFEGHTHKNYVKKDSYGVYHLQGGGDNDGISHATASVNAVTGSVSVTTAEYMPSSLYEIYEDHPLIGQLSQKYAHQLEAGEALLGVNARTRYSSQIKQKVADLYLSCGIERWGKEYELVLGGGFISTRSPYDLAQGEVRYADLQMLLPFDNQIVLCSIKGSDLLKKFINTSNSNYYITFSEYGNGIKNTVDPNATYYIITDSYCSSYAPNRLTVIDTYDETTFARDLIAQFIRGGGWSK